MLKHRLQCNAVAHIVLDDVFVRMLQALAVGLDSDGSGDTKDAIVIEYDDFMKV